MLQKRHCFLVSVVSPDWIASWWLMIMVGSDDGRFITGVNMEVDGGRGV